jgi:hypothetical protein
MEPREPWMDICALASVEMDSKKLMALVAEVDRPFGRKGTNCQRDAHATPRV